MSNSPTPPPPREGQSYTPGTISVRRAPNAVARCTNIVSDKTGRDIALVCIRGEPDNEWQGNAARLVDSWNACLPFPSPATDVPRLIAACKPFLDAADQRADWRCRNPGWNPDAHIEITMRHSELAALLAALPPEVRP